MKNHSGLKPHQCSFCPYATNKMGNLRMHKEKMHKELYEEELRQDLLAKIEQVNRGNTKGAFAVTGL